MCRVSACTVLDNLRARDLLEIVDEVCARRGVVVRDLCGRVRTRSVSWARQEVWWRLRHHPERYYSMLEIGRLFGRDHATVKAGIDAHCRRLAAAGPAEGKS